MSNKPVTIIISDLHLGGGPDDKGDDHIYQNSELIRFLQHIEEREQTPGGQQRQIELIINGDFLEFAQVKPEIYTLASSKYWCSEKESMEKLDAILKGHADIFAALKDFQTRGHQVTVAAGNHDVDLYWWGVRDKLKEAAGPVTFELEKKWYFRYDDRLAISHGHMLDPANSFNKWEDPIIVDDNNVPRLEMCPGTLFMVRFVNPVERDHPFVDNIKPVTALRSILWREKRPDFWVVTYLFLKFIDEYPTDFLGTDEQSATELGQFFLESLKLNDPFAREITLLYRKIYDSDARLEDVRQRLKTEAELRAFLYEMIARVPYAEWEAAFRTLPTGSHILSISDEAVAADPEAKGVPLSILRSNFRKEKEALREAAERQRLMGREVVVMGHTHQPDEVRVKDGGYFNPGSWTRFVDLNKFPSLTLDNLKDELAFPYQLNYIRVEEQSNGKLRADKICFEEAHGSFG